MLVFSLCHVACVAAAAVAVAAVATRLEEQQRCVSVHTKEIAALGERAHTHTHTGWKKSALKKSATFFQMKINAEKKNRLPK